MPKRSRRKQSDFLVAADFRHGSQLETKFVINYINLLDLKVWWGWSRGGKGRREKIGWRGRGMGAINLMKKRNKNLLLIFAVWRTIE
jgi:hypothetical protein